MKLRTVVWDEMTKLWDEMVDYSSIEFFIDEVDDFTRKVLKKAVGNDSKPRLYKGWVTVDLTKDPDLVELAEFLGEVPLRDFLRILPDNRVVRIYIPPSWVKKHMQA